MPGESFIQVDEGSGKKLRAWERSVGANTVYESAMQIAESRAPTFVAAANGGLVVPGVSGNIFELMAGGSLPLVVKRIRVTMSAYGAGAGIFNFGVYRLTTAGSGGSVENIFALDSSDAASGANARSLPSTSGTTGGKLWPFALTHPTSGTELPAYEWTPPPGGKGIVVPAGTTNGFAIRRTGGSDGTAAYYVSIEFIEGSF